MLGRQFTLAIINSTAIQTHVSLYDLPTTSVPTTYFYYHNVLF